MQFNKALSFLKGPVIAGLLLGLVALQIFPELNPRVQKLIRDNSAQNPGGFASYQPEQSYSEAVKRATPAVVNIFTSKDARYKRQRFQSDPLYRYYYDSADIPRQERMQSALGSGVIVSEQGYLLTNNHVIFGADEIVVQLQDGRESQAKLVGVDVENDLAVLKIELDRLTAIPIGSPQDARVGDIVLAIGNPFGMGQTVTQGIISATHRRGLGISTFENFLQTDAAINPGNSGGALVDTNGHLLGINTAILNRQGNAELEGVGLAVPADTAVRSLEDIVENGRVVRGWLGVDAQSLTPRLAASFQLKSVNGVLITGIYNNGPAHQAGLQPGDIIIKINNQLVGDGSRGRQEIAESRPGETVDIEFYRDGQTQSVKAVLSQRPTTG